MSPSKPLPPLPSHTPSSQAHLHLQLPDDIPFLKFSIIHLTTEISFFKDLIPALDVETARLSAEIERSEAVTACLVSGNETMIALMNAAADRTIREAATATANTGADEALEGAEVGDTDAVGCFGDTGAAAGVVKGAETTRLDNNPAILHSPAPHPSSASASLDTETHPLKPEITRIWAEIAWLEAQTAKSAHDLLAVERERETGTETETKIGVGIDQQLRASTNPGLLLGPIYW
ncbi:hypothetical protein MMC30_005477 [Trapelia coarctata]|nr:hypothetical protein [Trapelia coarctata]